MATKAKLRVTLKRFCGVAKVEVTNESAMQATIVAATTQNTWLARSPDQRVWVLAAFGLSSNADIGVGLSCGSFNFGLPCESGSGGGDGSGDESSHFFRRGRFGLLVRDFV